MPSFKAYFERPFIQRILAEKSMEWYISLHGLPPFDLHQQRSDYCT